MEARSPQRALVLVVLRGLVFVPGMLLSILAFVGLAHAGVDLVLVFGQLALAPLAVVCWVQASGRGGDRWTLGYVAVWVVDLGLFWLGSLLI